MISPFMGFDCMTNRWEVTGSLVMHTALHIGSGEESGGVDAGVALDAAGRPFVPGSSLKGVLRSEAERAAPLFGLRACGLFSNNGVDCLTTDRKRGDDYRKRASRGGASLDELSSGLCDTCRLFGSPFAASRVAIDDLPLDPDYDAIIERRDGVGIDRDSGTAAEHIKYDFHVVPAGARFLLKLSAENLTKSDGALLAFVLHELAGGSYGIGGKRSRGLGRCKIENLSIAHYALDSADGMLAYLKRANTQPPGDSESRSFLLKRIEEAVNA